MKHLPNEIYYPKIKYYISFIYLYQDFQNARFSEQRFLSFRNLSLKLTLSNNHISRSRKLLKNRGDTDRWISRRNRTSSSPRTTHSTHNKAWPPPT